MTMEVQILRARLKANEDLAQKLVRRCQEKDTRIKELEDMEREGIAVCNSYASENQRLSDERDAIKAETIERCMKWLADGGFPEVASLMMAHLKIAAADKK